jgi:multidrug transporter EmrE-like cation transporter
MKTSLYLILFWLMQMVAQLFFKWGSIVESRWTTGFIVGNLFGFSSIWLLMLVYKSVPANVALALGTAGAFLFGQIGLAIAFKSPLTPWQIAGMLAIIVGIVMVSMQQQSQ